MFAKEQGRPTRRKFLAAGVGVTAAAGTAVAGLPAPAGEPSAALVGPWGGVRTYVLAFHKGEEVLAGLLAFVRENRLAGGHFTGLGAVKDAVLAFFDPAKNDYKRIPVTSQAEVASLTGTISFKQGKPFVHAHAVLGLPDGSTRGGHLLEAHVWPTLEVVVTAWHKPVGRKRDSQTGLFLLDP